MSITIAEPELELKPSGCYATNIRATRAWAKGRTIFVELRDGRTVNFQAERFRILSRATDEELTEVTVRVRGFALRWENLDEDITVPGIVAGRFQLPA